MTVFVVTFVVFPGISLDTTIKFLGGLDPDIRSAWKGLLIVFLFNLLDTVGR